MPLLYKIIGQTEHKNPSYDHESISMDQKVICLLTTNVRVSLLFVNKNIPIFRKHNKHSVQLQWGSEKTNFNSI